MKTLQFNDRQINYQLSPDNIHIVDSHLITNPQDMAVIVALLRADAENEGFGYKRTNAAWVTEWKAHNVLYKWGFKKDRTGSVDLNEDESTIRLIGYAILSLFHER